jgi:hypothetical protein
VASRNKLGKTRLGEAKLERFGPPGVTKENQNSQYKGHPGETIWITTRDETGEQVEVLTVQQFADKINKLLGASYL